MIVGGADDLSAVPLYWKPIAHAFRFIDPYAIIPSPRGRPDTRLVILHHLFLSSSTNSWTDYTRLLTPPTLQNLLIIKAESFTSSITTTPRPTMDHQAALEAFTPKETVTISVGRYHAQVYVKVTPDMLDFERSFAFHQTVSALKLLPIDPQLFLDTLGNQLNASVTKASLSGRQRPPTLLHNTFN